MIYARLLIMATLPLAALYYFFVILQLIEVLKFTKAEIRFPMVLIPFYYFFKSESKKQQNKTKKTKKTRR